MKMIDKKGNELYLGDTVTRTTGLLKGERFILCFSIPQHRYGFILERFYNEHLLKKRPETIKDKYYIDYPDFQFYYTPRNSKIINKI